MPKTKERSLGAALSLYPYLSYELGHGQAISCPTSQDESHT